MLKQFFILLVFVFLCGYSAAQQIEAPKADSLLQMLCTENDSAAFSAFQTLSQTEPDNLKKSLDLFFSSEKSTARLHKQFSPYFLKSFLWQLALFTHYCREKNIQYQPSDALQIQFRKLSANLPDYERYHLENALANLITLQDISAVEYYALLTGVLSKDYFTISAARIIDIFYSEHWKEITTNDTQLLLYLKKAELFDELDIRGICHRYLGKFNFSAPQTIEKLRFMEQHEIDKGLRKQILLVLQAQPNPANKKQLKKYVHTLKDIDYSISFIKIDTSEQNYRFLSRKINHSFHKQKRNALLGIIRNNTSFTMVPGVYRLLDNHRTAQLITRHIRFRGGYSETVHTKINVSQKAQAMLEEFYRLHADNSEPSKDQSKNRYSYFEPSEERNSHGGNSYYWKSLWKKEKKSYHSWAQEAYRYQLAKLDTCEETYISTLNGLFYSHYYQAADRTIIMSSLKKVSFASDLEYLVLREGDSLQASDLPYISDLPFGHSHVATWNKFSNSVWTNYAMIDYIKSKATEFKKEGIDEFWASIPTTKLLSIVLIDSTLSNFIKNTILTNDLPKQLESKSLQSMEYIRIATAEANYRSSDEQFIKILTLNAPEYDDIKSDFLSDLGKSAVPYLLKHKKEIVLKPYALHYYLMYDLGILLPDNEIPTLWETLENYHKFSGYNFYIENLKTTGINILTKENNPDFSLIYKMLRYDIIGEAYTNSGNRIDTVLPVFRFLELYFNTNLGYPARFENYVGNDEKNMLQRANDWILYLQNKKLIVVAPFTPPSFQSCTD